MGRDMVVIMGDGGKAVGVVNIEVELAVVGSEEESISSDLYYPWRGGVFRAFQKSCSMTSS